MSSDDSFPLLLSHSDLPGPFLICIHAFDGLCDCDVHQCQVQMNSRVVNGKWLCPMTEKGFGALSSLCSFTQAMTLLLLLALVLNASFVRLTSLRNQMRKRNTTQFSSSRNRKVKILRTMSGLSIISSQLFPYQVSGKMAASSTCPRIFQALSSSTSKLS
jgi:hypothetical protein